MKDRKVGLDFRLKNDERRTCLLKEVERNNFISEKHKNVSRLLNYSQILIVLISVISGFVSSSAFASLLGVVVSIASFAVGLKISVITAEILKSVSQLSKKSRKSMIK